MALFDWDYNTLWGDRNGFAKLALSTGIDRPNTHSVIGFTFTGAPIIPIFTENIRQAFDTVSV